MYSLVSLTLLVVPQGSALGPTLFLLFINDVCDVFEDLKVVCKLYADDVTLYTAYDLNETVTSQLLHNGWYLEPIPGSLVWLYISVLSVDFKTQNGIHLITVPVRFII